MVSVTHTGRTTRHTPQYVSLSVSRILLKTGRVCSQYALISDTPIIDRRKSIPVKRCAAFSLFFSCSVLLTVPAFCSPSLTSLFGVLLSRHDPKLEFCELIIPTVDSVRYTYLLNLLIAGDKHVLMTGVVSATPTTPLCIWKLNV